MNHARAGTGYFRYLHHGNEYDCTDPYAQPPNGSATQPWIADFRDFQVGVTDTSTHPSTESGTTQAFADQLNLLGQFFRETKSRLYLVHVSMSIKNPEY